jgi:hypothetical protein
VQTESSLHACTYCQPDRIGMKRLKQSKTRAAQGRQRRQESRKCNVDNKCLVGQVGASLGTVALTLAQLVPSTGGLSVKPNEMIPYRFKKSANEGLLETKATGTSAQDMQVNTLLLPQHQHTTCR